MDAVQWTMSGDHPQVQEMASPTAGGSLNSKHFIDTKQGRRAVRSSDWIVKNPDGSYEHYRDEEFQQQFERA